MITSTDRLDGKDGTMQATAVIPAKIDPPAHPLSLLPLLHAMVRNPIQSWPRAVYRERLHRRRLMGHDALFVMDPALIRQVLVDEAENFEKGVMARRALEPLLGDAILITEGARWRWQRRAAAPLFRHEQLLDFLPAMIAATERTRDRWLTYPAGREINVAHEMMRTTFDVVLATMLPGSGPGDMAAMERAIADYLKSMTWAMALTIVGAPSWTPYPGMRKARRGRDYLRRLVQELRTKVAQSGSSGNDLLSLLVEANDPQTDKILQQPLQIVAGMAVLADRPGNGLTWDASAVKHYQLS